MYERAKPILSKPVESQGSGDVRIELEGAIEVSHVSFRYDRIGPLDPRRCEPPDPAGRVRGVGRRRRAPAKSTLLRLLLGFETCTEGGVFYDGQALAGLDVRVVRQQIGVVLQNSRVMAGDILQQHRRHQRTHASTTPGAPRERPRSTRTSRRCRWACTPSSRKAAERSPEASGSGF